MQRDVCDDGWKNRMYDLRRRLANSRNINKASMIYGLPKCRGRNLSKKTETTASLPQNCLKKHAALVFVREIYSNKNFYRPINHQSQI